MLWPTVLALLVVRSTALRGKTSCQHNPHACGAIQEARGPPLPSGCQRLPKLAIPDFGKFLHEVSNRTTNAQFLEEFRRLAELQAVDVMATKETWTVEDTEWLRYTAGRTRVAGVHNGSGFSHDEVLRRLPSCTSLQGLANSGSLAVVGSSAVLLERADGHDIDAHDLVARFNDQVGHSLIPKHTGTKTSMACVNGWVLPDYTKPVFDLEYTYTERSYCSRMMAGGHGLAPADATLFMIRPTARCQKMKINWTRGFMFFWLFGSLFEEVSLYGFQGAGRKHMQAQKRPVHEGTLPFEHAVLRILHEHRLMEQPRGRRSGRLALFYNS